MKFPLILSLAYAAIILPLTSSCTAQVTTPVSTENAVWLGHGFVAGAGPVQDFPRVASFMRDHKVRYLFINIGLVGKDGKSTRGEAGFPQVRQFLAAADTWEKANNYRFSILAWLNGSTDEASARYVDLSKDDVRAAMVEESRKISDPSVDGSYVAGVGRPFDGVQWDLEPTGANDAKFAGLRKFMDELKVGLGKTKLTSFTAQKFGTTGRYWWSPSYFHYMARRVDLLCAMTYDSGVKTEDEYKVWMSGQTRDVLNAVSGATWKNDADHPAPKNGVKVFIGFPGFPSNNYHVPAAETIAAAAAGAKDALSQMKGANSTSLPYFAGAAVYLYTDGSGKDNYSNEATDWKAFEDGWLKP